MSISNEEYGRMAKRLSPNSPVVTDCIKAFIFGGSICAFAEGFNIAFSYTSMTQEESKALTMIILIAITAILTAFGVFDTIAKHAGAGTMVPITGFANSIVCSALEFQTEGRILGTAAQMFTIAGPVIVFGCSTAALYGLIIYLFGLY
ncbi:MAG: SpoVA/SpoVAEb family sporulation membrane protein [Clostridia bacterium]|nr:SpoVA/SpoVAEb family sporulation membrane protein [Clostridia bacterium]